MRPSVSYGQGGTAASKWRPQIALIVRLEDLPICEGHTVHFAANFYCIDLTASSGKCVCECLPLVRYWEIARLQLLKNASRYSSGRILRALDVQPVYLDRLGPLGRAMIAFLTSILCDWSNTPSLINERRACWALARRDQS
jgi:hypothetical protein